MTRIGMRRTTASTPQKTLRNQGMLALTSSSYMSHHKSAPAIASMGMTCRHFMSCFLSPAASTSRTHWKSVCNAADHARLYTVACIRRSAASEEFAEGGRTEPCILGYATHRVCVDGVVPGNSDDAFTV